MSDEEYSGGGGRASASRWSSREDDLLSRAVGETGTDGTSLSVAQWAQISKKFSGRRRGKECRERWENKLRPGLREGDWTREEHEKIMQLAQEQGHVWRLIASELDGRSPASVKNYYYSFMRRVSRAEAGKAPRKRRQGPPPPVDIKDFTFTGLTEKEEAKSARDASMAPRRSSASPGGRSRHRRRSRAEYDEDDEEGSTSEEEYREGSGESEEEGGAGGAGVGYDESGGGTDIEGRLEAELNEATVLGRRMSSRVLEKRRQRAHVQAVERQSTKESLTDLLADMSSGARPPPPISTATAATMEGESGANHEEANTSRPPPFSSPRLAMAAEELANLSASLMSNVDNLKHDMESSPPAADQLGSTQASATASAPPSESARGRGGGGGGSKSRGSTASGSRRDSGASARQAAVPSPRQFQRAKRQRVGEEVQVDTGTSAAPSPPVSTSFEAQYQQRQSPHYLPGQLTPGQSMPTMQAMYPYPYPSPFPGYSFVPTYMPRASSAGGSAGGGVGGGQEGADASTSGYQSGVVAVPMHSNVGGGGGGGYMPPGGLSSVTGLSPMHAMMPAGSSGFAAGLSSAPGQGMPAFPIAFPYHMWGSGMAAPREKGEHLSSPVPSWVPIFNQPQPGSGRRDGSATDRSQASASGGGDSSRRESSGEASGRREDEKAGSGAQRSDMLPALLPIDGQDSRSSEHELMSLAFPISGLPFLPSARSTTPTPYAYFRTQPPQGEGGGPDGNRSSGGMSTISTSEALTSSSGQPEGGRPPSASMFFESGLSPSRHHEVLSARQPEGVDSVKPEGLDLRHSQGRDSGHTPTTERMALQAPDSGTISAPSSPAAGFSKRGYMSSGRQSSQSIITETAEPLSDSRQEMPFHDGGGTA